MADSRKKVNQSPKTTVFLNGKNINSFLDRQNSSFLSKIHARKGLTEF